MTLWEFVIGGPAAGIIVVIAVFTAIAVPLIMVGLPLFMARVWRAYKKREKIRFWKILKETYF